MMIEEIKHVQPPSDVQRLYQLLVDLDDVFYPKLSDRVDIFKYAEKLTQNAENFYVRIQGIDIANCAVYMNQGNRGYISSFGVKESFQNCGIGSQLMKSVILAGKQRHIDQIDLEVAARNHNAITFYASHGFRIYEEKADWLKMRYMYEWKDSK